MGLRGSHSLVDTGFPRAVSKHRLGHWAALKRIGFILEVLGLCATPDLSDWTADLSRVWPLLNPQGPRRGVCSSGLKVIMNVPVAELETWKGS